MERMNINLRRKERAQKIKQFKIEEAQRLKQKQIEERNKKIQESKERAEEEKMEKKLLEEKMKEEEKKLKEEEEKKRKEEKEKRAREDEEAKQVLRAKKKMKMSTSEAIKKLLGNSDSNMFQPTTVNNNGHLQFVPTNGFKSTVPVQTTLDVPQNIVHAAEQQQQQQEKIDDTATKSTTNVDLTTKVQQQQKQQDTKESSEVRNKEMEDILNLDTVDNTPTGMNGSVWYIMSENWLRSWRHYVFGVQSAPRPGPVDNWNLLKSHDDNDFSKQKAKEGLRQVEDYRGVNRMVWEYFVNIYGGGPPIVRKDLDIHLPPLDPKSMGSKIIPPAVVTTPVLTSSKNNNDNNNVPVKVASS